MLREFSLLKSPSTVNFWSIYSLIFKICSSVNWLTLVALGIFNEFYDVNEIKNHKCGSEYLIKRIDDNKDAIINRYEEYMKQTKPVLDFYSKNPNFYEIDGDEKIEEITSKISEILTV